MVLSTPYTIADALDQVPQFLELNCNLAEVCPGL